MRYAVLGTGDVGRTLGGRLAELGHEVTLGSRTKDNPTALEWARSAGAGARAGTFAEAASSAEVVVVAVGGRVALAALEAAGAARTRAPRSRSPVCSGSSGGRRTGCSIWAASGRHAAWRCCCRCGSISSGIWGTRSSTWRYAGAIESRTAARPATQRGYPSVA